MEAISFGDRGALFGVRSEASGEIRQTAILICNSWSAEYMRAHLGLRLFAEQLAMRGFDVLRFDYRCTGDSAGDAADAGVELWLSDIEAAAAELRRSSGAQRLCLFGVRLGALLIMELRRRQRLGGTTLALWDMPADGAQWLIEADTLNEALRERKNRYVNGRDLLPKVDDELLGIACPPRLRSEIAGLRAETVHSPSILHFRSKDMATLCAATGTIVDLPNQAHWLDVNWLTRMWTPTQSLTAMSARLAAQLP